MNKIILVLFIFFYSSCLIAGDLFSRHHYSTFRHYDKYTNNLIIGVFPKKQSFGSQKIDDTKFTNLLIYNLVSKKKKFIFDASSEEIIRLILFEEKYDKDERRIVFNKKDDVCGSSCYIINNSNIEERKAKPYLYIVTLDKKLDKYTLWKSLKNGENVEKIISIAKYDDFHFDIGRQVIRVIFQDELETRIMEISY